jgi:BASS family bile acid:Na+ symporter
VEESSITAVLLPIALGDRSCSGSARGSPWPTSSASSSYPKAGHRRASPARCSCCRWCASRIAKGFGLSPELAVGLMLLAASPGGATANLFSHLAKGDVALNITLTAVNSVLSLLTLPLIVNFVARGVHRRGPGDPHAVDKVVQVFASC